MYHNSNVIINYISGSDMPVVHAKKLDITKIDFMEKTYELITQSIEKVTGKGLIRSI